jgi:hypothetical protein
MGPRHVGFGPGVIDEDQAGRIKPPLILSPLRPPPGDVRTILFAGLQAFFLKLMPSCSKKCHTAKWLTLIPRAASSAPSARNVMSGFSANRARSQSRARQWIWPAATNLVSRGASGRPEPLRPLHNARNVDLELGRDRTTALPGRNRRNHTLAQIKRIGSGHQMLASIPANTLNHIRNNRGIPPIQKKSATL